MGPCEEDFLSKLDSNSEEDLDEEGDDEVHDDAVLLGFAATLQKAYDISAAEEKEKGAAWGHYLPL